MAIREDQIASQGSFGAVPIFAGTLLITLIAMFVSIPIGLTSAIYLSEYASPSIRTIIKPLLEILAGVPTVVAYKLNPITFIIAKVLYKPKFISLVNISAEVELMPEFLQKDVNSNTLSKALSLYIQNDELRDKISKKLTHQIIRMRPKGKLGNNLAAEKILEFVKN